MKNVIKVRLAFVMALSIYSKPVQDINLFRPIGQRLVVKHYRYMAVFFFFFFFFLLSHSKIIVLCHL